MNNKYDCCSWCGVSKPESVLSEYCDDICRYAATGKRNGTLITAMEKEHWKHKRYEYVNGCRYCHIKKEIDVGAGTDNDD